LRGIVEGQLLFIMWSVLPGPVQPMLLQRLPEPFDHQDFVFELKYDGFRALAFITNRSCRLVSRNRNEFMSWGSLREDLGRAFPASDVILDGELVCLDPGGRPQFNNLLFRREEPCFLAFDLLYRDGKDLRNEALLERKRILRESVSRAHCERLVYVDHIERRGVELFQHACRLDLEGIVAKHRQGRYASEREQSTWFKIRNRDYSQWPGREELFDRSEHRERPGWDACDRAARQAA
jgi:bifunctional non-homologous end joining protein LigD